MALAICNFIQLRNPGGAATGFSYQNFFINQSSSVGGITYRFLPFAITSGAGKKGGDRASTSLVLTPNAISINVLAQAAESRLLLQNRTYEVDPIAISLRGLITDELWSITRMEHDTEKVILQLSSPLDAVGNQVPRRYLSNKLVGSLPTSGRLSMS